MRRPSRPARARPLHTDDWLITYADTITLLLCLFIVLLSVTSKQGGPAPATNAPPQASLPPAKRHVFESSQPTLGLAPANYPNEDKPAILPEAALVHPIVPPADDAAEAPAADTDLAENAPPAGAKHHHLMLLTPPPPPVSLPQLVARLKPQQAASIEQHGDRLTTVQISNTAFFGAGFATISAPGRAILQDVVGILTSPKFKDFQITVEGHTDDSPISNLQFPSNWELSTARAAAVVHFFLDHGIPAQRLRAAGYADTFPLAPNRDATGKPIPENQAKNRRVVIKLEKIEKSR